MSETKRQAVLRILQTAPDDGWVLTKDLSTPETGTEGTKRLRELRAMGYAIENRRRAVGSQWEYRLARRTVSKRLVDQLRDLP